MSDYIEGVGPIPALVMIVGEAPGRDEIKAGIPFVGPAGKQLDKLLEILDFPRELIYITNYCKRFLGKDKDLSPDEAAMMEDILRTEVREVNPDLIMSLGSIATSYFLGPCQITRANAIPYIYRGKLLVPSIYPASILYRPETKKDIEKAFRMAKEVLDGKVGIDNAKNRKSRKMKLLTALCLVGHLFPGSIPVVYRMKLRKEAGLNINITPAKED